MFRHRSHGLLDFLGAALLLWAAAWHTPLGALGRSLAGRLTGVRTTARPLLAYYSGGVYDVQSLDAPPPGVVLPSAQVLATLAPGDALSRAVLATLATADTTTRARAAGLAKDRGVAALNTPAEVARVLELQRKTFGTDDAAVLSLMAGHEVARFAVQRAKAEGADATLEALLRQLPPGSKSVGLTSSALTLGTALGLAWPVSQHARISSPFGWRMHPTLGRSQLHTGVDISVPTGTPVKVTADGFVRRASEDAVNGRVVIVDHGRGVTTAYCHNSSLLVRTGSRVFAGQVVAFSGSTGRSTGPHLHYQLGVAGRPVDPLAFRGPRPAVAALPAPPAPAKAPKPSPRLQAAFEEAQVLEVPHDERRGEGAAAPGQP